MAPDDKYITPLEVTDSIEDGKTIHSKNVDEALGFLEQNAHNSDLPAVDDKKLMRRVDWMLMPLMFGCYYLQYTDKTLSPYLSLYMNVQPTNVCHSVLRIHHGHHTRHKYATEWILASRYRLLLFFLSLRTYSGRSDSEVPYCEISGRQWYNSPSIDFTLLTLRPVVTLWGLVLTMNCVCHDFASLMALRVLLGVFESVTAPRSVAGIACDTNDNQ